MKNYLILGASIIIGLSIHGFITRGTCQTSAANEDDGLYQISAGGLGVYRVNKRTGEIDYFWVGWDSHTGMKIESSRFYRTRDNNATLSED